MKQPATRSNPPPAATRRRYFANPHKPVNQRSTRVRCLSRASLQYCHSCTHSGGLLGYLKAARFLRTGRRGCITVPTQLPSARTRTEEEFHNVNQLPTFASWTTRVRSAAASAVTTASARTAPAPRSARTAPAPRSTSKALVCPTVIRCSPKQNYVVSLTCSWSADFNVVSSLVGRKLHA